MSANSTTEWTPQVLIIGSGPAGATYARTLVDQGIRVLMIEMGAQERPIIGDHMKNSVPAQKNINKFMDVIKGQLDQLSVEVGGYLVPTVEPISYRPDESIQYGCNPRQETKWNLRAEAAARTVGGMSAHWTCCTPRQHPTHERSKLFCDSQWDKLYTEAEKLLKTNSVSFDNSVRQKLLLDTLNKAYAGKKEFLPMPLACCRPHKNKCYVEWSSTRTVLGDDIALGRNENFRLLSQHQCMELKYDRKRIKHAVVKNLLIDEKTDMVADMYVVCAGAILTPGLLFKLGFDETLEALGEYLTEQTLAFCQVVLKKELVEGVKNGAINLGRVDECSIHGGKHPEDSVPFPFDDPDPQVYLPVTEDRLWQAQIHRDAFSFGQTPPGIDQRLVVDLRFFGPVKPRRRNMVTFSKRYTDAYGMPQPTFHYELSAEDASVAHDMMCDMVDVARHLGGWLPGAEPKLLEHGTALHLCGTTRAGESKENSVVDASSKVWDCDNLYLGGLGVVPGANASNPLLTAMCFALEGARAIIDRLSVGTSKKQ